MKIQRAFKVPIYLSNEQQVFLNKPFGSCCLLYNKMLDERIKTYESLKDDREALSVYMYKHAYSSALQQVRRNLESVYTNFYQSLKDSRKGELAGFPRFKVKTGELRSVDMKALALGKKGETVVGIPEMGRSRNLVEQVERLVQAISPWLFRQGLRQAY